MPCHVTFDGAFWRRSFVAFVVGTAVLSVPGLLRAASPDIVISQIYGGGGNAGATLRNDFIELFNRGGAPVNVNGWSVQYASATGTTWARTNLPNLTLQPGQYLLVQEAQGTGGTQGLPTADATGTIAMSATAGKVALVTNSTTLTCSSASQCLADASVRDFVGFGPTANMFEGAGPTPAPSNTNAVLRAANGCTDTDNNNGDFAVGTPVPRNSTSAMSPCTSTGDQPVVATCPATLATTTGSGSSAAVSASDTDGTVTSGVITSGPVTGITLSDFTPAGAAGGTATARLNVASNTAPGTYSVEIQFSNSDAAPQTGACTVTVGVSNPPPTSARIRDIQGSAHISPLNGQSVTGVPGIVTAVRSNGFYMQDPAPDTNPATSEGILVFSSSAPAVLVGDAVQVSGTVTEFRAGGADGLANLTITEITTPTIVTLSRGNALPPPIIIGSGGRIPPQQIINSGNCGNVELTSCSFEPGTDGIDFYESLEGMRVQINNAVATGPTNNFGEISVIGDLGANATQRTPRGGVYVSAADFNPERIILDDTIRSVPTVNVGDSLAQVIGVMDYSFGNFKLLVTEPLSVTTGTLAQEITSAQDVNQLAVASFNVENLDPSDPPAKFAALAAQIVTNLRSPDIIAVMEIQDNNGATNDALVDAATTFNLLISAIQNAGGPTTYQYRNINPVDDQDGGEPGGNIRVGFLFNTARVSFIDRAGGTSTAATTIVNNGGKPQLSFSPGRVDPTNAAFNSSRKPLAGEFNFQGHQLFVIANHFNSKGGDQPLFGRFQPPALSSEAQRVQQAQVLKGFVEQIFAVDGNAKVVVLGDLNDFEFSTPLSILKSAGLNDLVELLPPEQRYTYVFDGNSQVLDHILVSNSLMTAVEYDIVHTNSEFAVRATDHDPEVVRLFLPPLVTEVTSQMATQSSGLVYNRSTQRFSGTLRITNNGASALNVPLQVELEGLPAGVTLANASGQHNGAPYITLSTPLAAGATVSLSLQFNNPSRTPIAYSVRVYSGSF